MSRLFVVGVPVGNLAELSPRAAEILAAVDIIACEDTRYTGLLMQHIGTKKPLISCHKFNERSRIDRIIGELLAGRDVALVSDAGTPCVSDPGYLLIAAAVEAGIEVVGVSGPCAVTLALSVSGFDASEFAFLGFLPRARRPLLEKFAKSPFETMVFYESPMRIMSTMKALFEANIVDAVCLCNDLTKQHERLYRGTVGQVLDELAANPNREKGEYTGVLRVIRDASASNDDAVSIEAQLVDIIVKNNVSLRDAMERVDAPRNEMYRAGLRLKELFRVS